MISSERRPEKCGARRRASREVSHEILIRSARTILMSVETELMREVRGSEPPRQPATHDATAYVEFEDYWLEIVRGALSRTRAN